MSFEVRHDETVRVVVSAELANQCKAVQSSMLCCVV